MADSAAVVVAALSMLAAVFVMVRHGARLTSDLESNWRKKFEELEAAHTYLVRNVREIERKCEEEQERLQSVIKVARGHIDEMVVKRQSDQLEIAELRSEVAALRRALAER